MATKLLTRDQILAARKNMKSEEVEIPEWGGSVRVRELSAAEMNERTGLMLQKRGDSVVMAADGKTPMMSMDGLLKDDLLLAAFSIVDEDGNRLFALNDLKMLGELSETSMKRVVTVAKRLSGITEAEEALKNSLIPKNGDLHSD